MIAAALNADVRSCALELRDVHKRFGATPIIRGVSLEVIKGERHAIIGPNGAGKSTLFNLISGRFAPSSGSIRLNGEEVAGRAPFDLYRRGLSRSFQVTNIYPRLSVYENIRCSLLWSLGYRYNFWRSAAKLSDANERTEKTLEQIGMASRRNALAGVLTYAEQRALEIGITIAGDSSVILLDELNLADRISVLVYGAIIASDIPERIRSNAAVQTAYLGDAHA
jgi:branched-chain amino acid transport system ATP-binding protein